MSKSGPNKSLTPKEKMILEHLESYFREHAMAPSFREIKEHFGFASFFSVQRYLKQLEEKDYIRLGGNNQKRAIELLHCAEDIQSRKIASSSLDQEEKGAALSDNSLSLPLLGKVAAGLPLEHMKNDEFFNVPRNLVRNSSKSYVLQVEGESMIEDGILDGDHLVVQRQDYAKAGDTIVAMINNEATVKNFFPHTTSSSSKLSAKQKRLVMSGKNIELRPANSSLESMFFSEDEVQIQGLIVGLIRQY